MAKTTLLKKSAAKSAPTTNLKKSKTAPAPKAKVVEEVKTKKAPIKLVKNKKEAKPVYEIGQTVQFQGYAAENDTPLFSEGDLLTIVSVDNEDDGIMLSCIKSSDYAAYQEDSESVEGEQVSPEEVIAVKKTSKALVKAVAQEEKPMVYIGDMAKLLKKGDPLETAKNLMEDINKNFFHLGGMLAYIYSKGLYKAEFKGDDAWEQYCLQTFGFKGRKGQYLIHIYTAFSQLEGFKISSLIEIGWSKASKLASYVTDDNLDALISLAEQSNILDLDIALKTDYTTEGANASGKSATRTSSKVKRITFAFKLYEDQAEGTALILKEAMKQFGADHDESQTFERIMSEWAADHLGEEKVAKVNKAVSRKAKELEKAGVQRL